MKKNKFINIAILGVSLLGASVSFAQSNKIPTNVTLDVSNIVELNGGEKEFESREEALANGVTNVEQIDNQFDEIEKQNLLKEKEIKSSGPQDIGFNKRFDNTVKFQRNSQEALYKDHNGISQINKDTLNKHTLEGYKNTQEKLEKIY